MAEWYSHLLNLASGIVDMFTGGAATDYIMDEVTKKYNLTVQEANWLMQVAEQALNRAGDDLVKAKESLSNVIYAQLSSAPFSLRRASLNDQLAKASDTVEKAQSAYDSAENAAVDARTKVANLAYAAPTKLDTIAKAAEGFVHEHERI